MRLWDVIRVHGVGLTLQGPEEIWHKILTLMWVVEALSVMVRVQKSWGTRESTKTGKLEDGVGDDLKIRQEPGEKHAVLLIADLQSAGLKEPPVMILADTMAAMLGV